MGPSIRLATLEDAAALVELRLAFLDEAGHFGKVDTSPGLRQAVAQYFAEKIPAGEVFAWVAETEGRVVSTGALILVPKPPSPRNVSGLEAYVFGMYTVPAWRGKGLATRLFDEMVGFVKGTGARRIWLYATDDGRPLYTRAGFVMKHRQRPEMELVW